MSRPDTRTSEDDFSTWSRQCCAAIHSLLSASCDCAASSVAPSASRVVPEMEYDVVDDEDDEKAAEEVRCLTLPCLPLVDPCHARVCGHGRSRTLKSRWWTWRSSAPSWPTKPARFPTAPVPAPAHPLQLLWRRELNILADMGFVDAEAALPLLQRHLVTPVSLSGDRAAPPSVEGMQRVVAELLTK